MDRKKELTAIRDLIAHDNSQIRKDDGYIGDPDKLIRLTEKQAEIALHLGIPIGVCSQHDDYHGSRAGQYSYDMARTTKNLKYHLSQTHMESRASIYPYVPDPKRMYEYIRQVEEWGFQLNNQCLNSFHTKKHSTRNSQVLLMCNIRLSYAKNLYFIRVSEFVVMNTRTIEKLSFLSDSFSFCLYPCGFSDGKSYNSIATPGGIIGFIAYGLQSLLVLILFSGYNCCNGCLISL